MPLCRACNYKGKVPDELHQSPQLHLKKEKSIHIQRIAAAFNSDHVVISENCTNFHNHSAYCDQLPNKSSSLSLLIFVLLFSSWLPLEALPIESLGGEGGLLAVTAEEYAHDEPTFPENDSP